MHVSGSPTTPRSDNSSAVMRSPSGRGSSDPNPRSGMLPSRVKFCARTCFRSNIRIASMMRSRSSDTHVSVCTATAGLTVAASSFAIASMMFIVVRTADIGWRSGVVCSPIPRSMQKRRVSGVRAATQSGGCGCCNGRGTM